MSQQKHQDVVIVGGGIMGVCSAFALTRTEEYLQGQVRVTVVEEGDICGGASGKAAGFLARDWHEPPTESLGKFSFDLYERLAEEFSGKEAFGYRKVKSYAVDLKDPSERQSGAGTADYIPPPTRALPAETHWLSLPEDFKQGSFAWNKDGDGHPTALSWLNKDAISSVRMLSDEGTTAQLYPHDFCHRLWSECLKAGVQRVKGRAEKTTQRGDGTVERLFVRLADSSSNEAATVPVDQLVLAAGPWTGKLAKELFPTTTAKVPVPITELPGHSIIYKAPHTLPAEAVFITMREADATTGPECFTRPDGTIYIAGENTGAPLPPGIKAVDGGKDESILDKVRRAVSVLAPSLVATPSADGVSAAPEDNVKTQLCYRPISTRGSPILGRLPGADNVIICSGMGPWGIALGAGSGQVVAELVLGRETLSASIEQLGLSA
ncbi:unnamed protein product [Parajaminaea phylloscopi]